MRRRWHAAYTRPLAECAVNDSLRTRGFETLFLHEIAEARHARSCELVRRPLFSRYVVTAVEDDDQFSQIRSIPGVIRMLHDATGPLAIDERDIAALRKLGDENGLLKKPAAAVRKLLAPGTRIRIRGTLEPFLAIVLLDSGRVIEAKVKIFKRWTRGRFNPQSVEVVSPKRPPTS